MPKGETIERAFAIIQMFESGPVTARMIVDRFKIHRHCANRWINQASRFMPIVETGKDDSGGGRPGIVYEMLKEA